VDPQLPSSATFCFVTYLHPWWVNMEERLKQTEVWNMYETMNQIKVTWGATKSLCFTSFLRQNTDICLSNAQREQKTP